MVHPDVIERIEFLRPLRRAAREDLAARAITRRFRAGARLWDAGTLPRGLFVILSGRVRIVRTRGSRQHVVHTEGPGATIGEIPLFGGGEYPATAIASDDVECVVIDRAALAAAITAHPELAFALLARLAARVRHLLDRLAARTSDPVAVRLAAFLLARPERADGTVGLGGTQQQLAEELGTVREVVVRVLRRLVQDGMIQSRGRGRYAIVHRGRLRRLASEDAP